MLVTPRSERDILLASYVTSVLYTARISNVESVLCGDRVGKMVDFKLSPL